VYLAEAYSPLWGFLYGWTAFTFINPASIAALAVAFVAYLGFFVSLDPVASRTVAIGAIVLLTAINCYGVRLGATTQNVLTVTKIVVLVVLVIAGLVLPSSGVLAASVEMPSGGLMARFGLAMIICLWAYDGWMEVTYVGGEVRDPGRNIPRSIWWSLVIVVGVYLLLNAALLAALGVPAMAASSAVASDAAVATMGTAGAAFVAVGVMVSTLGSNNGIILTTARAPYAMARRGYFMQWAGAIHPRFKTPSTAIMLQALWASLLVLSGTFVQLVTFSTVVLLIFTGWTVTSLFVIRRKAPDFDGYRTWGYPFTPILFLSITGWSVVYTLFNRPGESLVGIGFCALGVPAYYFLRRRREYAE